MKFELQQRGRVLRAVRDVQRDVVNGPTMTVRLQCTEPVPVPYCLAALHHQPALGAARGTLPLLRSRLIHSSRSPARRTSSDRCGCRSTALPTRRPAGPFCTLSIGPQHCAICSSPDWRHSHIAPSIPPRNRPLSKRTPARPRAPHLTPAAARHDSSPPPPTGINNVSISGKSSNISIISVPWPLMILMSLKGCILL